LDRLFDVQPFDALLKEAVYVIADSGEAGGAKCFQAGPSEEESHG
jgi:hypothetical protein